MIKVNMSPQAVLGRLRAMGALWEMSVKLMNSKPASAPSERRRGVEIQDAIRKVLFTQWDPISIRDEGLLDEYDAYIAPLFRILVTTRDENQLIDTLQRIERDEIGMTPSDAAFLKPVANALLDLKVTLR